MGDYRAFIDDPSHLAVLQGDRYVVLRATGSASDAFTDVQATVREKLTGQPASYPASAHVTLAGWSEGADLKAVQDLVSAWAPSTPRIRLHVEKVSFFRPPFRIVIVQVRKTPQLFQAFVSLRDAARRRGFSLADDIPDDEWIFHMSVAYCRFVPEEVWEDVSAFVGSIRLPPARCEIAEAEVVAYDDGKERSGGAYELCGDRLAPA